MKNSLIILGVFFLVIGFPILSPSMVNAQSSSPCGMLVIMTDVMYTTVGVISCGHVVLMEV
ncbi:hypothetical protein [Anditalea andensis]|uniref:hypothetical protein n=1 Tax=Anditalea andensis TaxID=1048983 RepID=UPI0013E067AE|nr:hypothetical protein [Anditalea andensis]